MGRDRRRYPRAKAGLNVTVDGGGRLWEGKTIDLSPYGVKVESPSTPMELQNGTRVQLQLLLPDQPPSLSLTASVVRTDSDGIALSFDSLEDQQFQRLKEMVGTFLRQEWQEMLHETKATPPDANGSSNQPVAAPEKPFTATSDDSSKKDKWQALLNRVGLDLRLPSNGSLSREWLEFLERLETSALGSGDEKDVTPSKGSPSARRPTARRHTR